MSSMIVKSKLQLEDTDYQTICSLLLDRLKHNYDKTIIIDNESGQTWTGEQVYESALNLAYHFITECLLKPGDIVCFLAPDSGVHTIAMLAVWAAGGVYCSLPYRSTYREIDEALTKIEPAFVVTDAYNYSIGAVLITEMVSIKKLLLIDDKSVTEMSGQYDVVESAMAYERQFLRLPLDGSLDTTCALLIGQTSDGSTKAIVRTHLNLITTTLAIQHPDITHATDDRVLLLTSGLYSAAGLCMCLYGLSMGATLVILDTNRSSADDFLNCIQKHSITGAVLTSRQLHQCLKHNDMAKSLRDVWFVGTGMSEKTHSIATKLWPNFMKTYITAETGWVTSEYRPDNRQLNHKTIGRPVAGVELKIVDSNGRSLPHNKVGEICVRSHQCCPGYQFNETESQHILMTDGFIKTGEYGLYDESGLLYIVGHSEDFVKIDDFMVSTEELISVLLSHTGVKEAAVICAEDRDGCEYPKAFVSMKKDFLFDPIIVDNGQQSLEQSLVQFVNLRVDPRKWLRNDGIDMIMKDSPHPHLRKMSLKLETNL